MRYVALLRGINVGGKSRVEMARLKAVFEKLGLKDTVTYINSGNVIFSGGKQPLDTLVQQIEAAIESEFGFRVSAVVRDQHNIATIYDAVPADWVNDTTMKTDVMFLWQSYDSAKTLDTLTIKPDLDDVQYLPGAIIWRVDRQNATRSGMMRLAGTELYKHMTIRNINTLRKLHALMNGK